MFTSQWQFNKKVWLGKKLNFRLVKTLETKNPQTLAFYKLTFA